MDTYTHSDPCKSATISKTHTHSVYIKGFDMYHKTIKSKVTVYSMIIRESVDSLCRDGVDMPRPPYIGKACTRPNAMFVSLFRRLTVVLKCFCIYLESLTK